MKKKNQKDQIDDIKIKPDLLNVMILSFGLMVEFSAFNTTQGYITTLHQDIGHLCLAILYGVFSVANLIAPLIADLLGDKLTIIVGSFPYILFIFSIGLPYNFPILLCSGLVGLSAPLLWASQGSILTVSSQEKMSEYSGIWWAIFQTNSIFGYLIAGGLVLLKVSQLWIFIIFAWIFTFGLIILTFLKEKDYKKKEKKMNVKRLIIQISSTVKVCLDIKFILLYACFLFNGYTYGFYFGTITQKFGIDLIAWTFTCFAVSEFIGSYCFGKLINTLGHRYGYFVTIFFHAVSIAYTFTLDRGRIMFFFITISLCGIADSGLNTFIYSIIGRYYKNNPTAAFAAFKLIQSLSISFQFYTGDKFSFFAVQLALFGLMVLSTISYLFLELIEPADKFDINNHKNLNLFDLCCSCCSKENKKDLKKGPNHSVNFNKA